MRSVDMEVVKGLWEKYNLPAQIPGKSFIDVGCWAGGFCAEATKRGASKALGMDIIRSPSVEGLQKEYGFDFLVCDVSSERFLEIPRFDIVLCAGVLYHMKDPASLIHRLKLKTKELLVLETKILTDGIIQDEPVLKLYFELRGDHSVWWVPSRLAVEKLLEACGFAGLKCVYKAGDRACFHAMPANTLSKKTYPRRESFLNE